MQLRIECIADYKKLVKSVCSAASKKVLSHTEQCVFIKTEANKLVLTAMESESHFVSLNCEAFMIEQGTAVILASKLMAMTAKLNNKGIVNITKEGGKLKYTVPPYGSISEDLFHDQAEQKQLLLNTDDYSLISEQNDLWPQLLPRICNSVYEGTSIYMKIETGRISLYNRISQNGHVKYVTKGDYLTGEQTAASMYLKPYIAKTVAALGTEVSIKFNSAKATMCLESSLGRMILIGEAITSSSSNTTNQILAKPVVGEVTLNHSNLTEAVKWHSYGAGVSELLSLSVADNKKHLEIQCNRFNEAASLDIQSIGPIGSLDMGFLPISINLNSFVAALKTIGGERDKILPVETVLLQQRIINIADSPIRVLSLSSSEADELDTSAIVYLMELKLQNT